MYVKRHIEVLSYNHCCCRRAISITYSECVFVALDIQRAMRMRAMRMRAMRMRHTVNCGLPRSIVFFHIIS